MIRNKQNNEVIPPNSAHQAVVKPLPQALFQETGRGRAKLCFQNCMGRYPNDLDKVQEGRQEQMPRALHQDSGEGEIIICWGHQESLPGQGDV